MTAQDGALTKQDPAAISSTITLGTSSSSSSTGSGGGGSGGGSGTTGVGGAVSLNDVHGGATAYIDHTTLSTTGGNVLIEARETATLIANTTNEVTASTSTTGTGTTGSSLAVGGVISTNLVQSSADAELRHSHVTTTGAGAARCRLTPRMAPR